MLIFFPPQKYVSELSTVRDCVETCVEKGKETELRHFLILAFPEPKLKHALAKSNFTFAKHDIHA